MTERLEVVAIGGEPDHFGLLPDQIVNLWTAIEGRLAKEWVGPSPNNDVLRRKGCLDKLSATLLQASRLQQHEATLLAAIPPNAGPPGSCIAMRGLEALADFEGLLLHGRAALDRLAWFVSSRYKNSTSSFRKLATVLDIAAKHSPEASALASEVRAVSQWFDGLFGALDAPSSLRDLVGHNHSVTEGVETCFAVNYLTDKSAIIFDCEVTFPTLAATIPILTTSVRSIDHLARVVINSLAITSGLPPLQAEEFATAWQTKARHRTLFLTSDPVPDPRDQYTLVSIRRMTPSGYELNVAQYRPELFEDPVTWP